MDSRADTPTLCIDHWQPFPLASEYFHPPSAFCQNISIVPWPFVRIFSSSEFRFSCYPLPTAEGGLHKPREYFWELQEARLEMIVFGKMGHKTWMLVPVASHPISSETGSRYTWFRTSRLVSIVSRESVSQSQCTHAACTSASSFCLIFWKPFPLCLALLKPFLVWLFLKAERKMWVFVGLRFPIQYPLRQVRIVSQDRISGKRPKYFCQIMEFAQKIHFLK